MRSMAARRYMKRFTLTMALYLVLLAASVAIGEAVAPSPWLLGLLAVLTGLPIIGIIVAMGLYLRDESDEFVRYRLVTAMLIALGILFSATSILGLLQYEGIVGELPVFLAFPIWCGLFGVVQGLLGLRDRVGPEE